LITDCHVHIQPLELFKPAALELMKQNRANFAEIELYCRSAKEFLKYLDRCGVERAALINYVAPEVIGFTSAVNPFVAEYVKENPKRLIACGSLHPRHTKNILADVEEILRLGIRMIKIHPPHQLLYPNDYLRGVKELEIIYRAAEANEIPVMFHTGTSVFAGARNKYGDPMYVDDVAVDFPKLKILLTEDVRCGWTRRFFCCGGMPTCISISAGFRRRRCWNIFHGSRNLRTRRCLERTGRGRACRTLSKT